MNHKPIIGITVAHCTEELRTFPRAYYVESIKKAGGTPILLSLVRTAEEAQEVLNLVDGLILSGGGDISPNLLGEFPKRGIGECFPDRDISEILLAQGAMDRGLPLLGICRGIQVLAVAAGGTVIQDIPTQFPETMQHKQTSPREFPWHEVEVLESHLREILGEKSIGVNSIHHQAVLNIPDCFRINARAADGMIEGIEKMGARFCMGVQWHPEALLEDHSQKLFARFVKCAAERSDA